MSELPVQPSTTLQTPEVTGINNKNTVQTKEVSRGLLGYINNRKPREGINQMAEGPYKLISTSKPETNQAQTPGVPNPDQPKVNTTPESNDAFNPVDRAIINTMDRGADLVGRGVNALTGSKTGAEAKKPENNHTVLPKHMRMNENILDQRYNLVRREAGIFDLADKEGKIATGKEDPAKRFKLQAGDYSLVDDEGNLVDSKRKGENFFNRFGRKNNDGKEQTSQKPEVKQKPTTQDEYYTHRVDEWTKTHPEPAKNTLEHDGWENQRKIDMAHFKDMALNYALEQEFEASKPRPKNITDGKPTPQSEFTSWLHDRADAVKKRKKELDGTKPGTAAPTNETLTSAPPSGTQTENGTATPSATVKADTTIPAAPSIRPEGTEAKVVTSAAVDKNVVNGPDTATTVTKAANAEAPKAEVTSQGPKESATPAEATAATEKVKTERETRMEAYINEVMSDWENDNKEPANIHGPKHDKWQSDRAYIYEQAEIDATVHEDMMQWETNGHPKPKEKNSKEYNHWFKDWEKQRQEALKKHESMRTLPKRNDGVTNALDSLGGILNEPSVQEAIKKAQENPSGNKQELVAVLEKKQKGLGSLVALLMLATGGATKS